MDNEFEVLIDVLINKGVKHSDIVSLIQERVLQEFTSRYKHLPRDVEVIVNERNGDVRIVFDKTDITPSDFIPVAKNVALGALIQKLKEKESSRCRFSKVLPSEKSSLGGLVKRIINLLFWTYNGLYISFVLLFLVNILFNPEYRESIFETFETIEEFKKIALSILLVVPIASIIMAKKAKRAENNLRLDKIMFLFEMPLVTVFLFAVFSKNLTSAMWFFLLMIVFAIVAVFLESTGKTRKYSMWENG